MHDVKVRDIMYESLLRQTQAIKTSLTLINGKVKNLSLALSDKMSTSDQIELSQKIDSLKANIEQLLVYDQMPLPLTETLLNSFVAGTVALFRPLAKSKQIHFVYTSGFLNEQYYLDQEKIQKIIFHLLHHVFLNTPKGRSVKVELKYREKSYQKKSLYAEFKVTHNSLKKQVLPSSFPFLFSC